MKEIVSKSPTTLNVLITLVKGIDAKIDNVATKVEKLSEDNTIQKVVIEGLKTEILSIKKSQEGLSNRLEELEDKSIKDKAEKWNMIVDNALKIIVSLAFTAMLAYLGIKIKQGLGMTIDRLDVGSINSAILDLQKQINELKRIVNKLLGEKK